MRGTMVYAETYEQYASESQPSRVMGVGVITAIGVWLALNIVSLIEQRVREAPPTRASPGVCVRRWSAHAPRPSRSSPTSRRAARAAVWRLRLTVEEPLHLRYVLYRLEGDTCPECGRPVPAEDRWAAARAGVDSSGGGSPPSQPG
ncbi:MAG: hypothetical protein R3B49_10380 [Phycisphaerales bacterium]